MKRSIKLILVAVFAVVLVASLFLAMSAGGECCHVSAQDDGQGNPGHVEPTQQCAHKPTGKQVGCKCARACSETGGEVEDVKCKSFCFRNWCTCPSKPCP
jgi:hypothetical protein